MKDGQKQYRILRIDEPDFGCEGRDDGEAAYDEITLVNEQGETCLVRMEEQQVWSMGINIAEALLGLLLVWRLLPVYALAAYIGVIYFSEIFNFSLSCLRLKRVFPAA